MHLAISLISYSIVAACMYRLGWINGRQKQNKLHVEWIDQASDKMIEIDPDSFLVFVDAAIKLKEESIEVQELKRMANK